MPDNCKEYKGESEIVPALQKGDNKHIKPLPSRGQEWG